jgi:branched-chain amino acid transport system permease protein
MAAIRPSGIYDVSYQQDMELVRTPALKVAAVVSAIAFFALPLFSRDSPLGLEIVPLPLLGTLNRIGITLISVQGLNILLGYTGQVSLGQAAFMAVGAYTSTVLVAQFGIPFWFALPLAAMTAGVVGLIFGLPSLRVKGFYLAMATLAAQFIIPWLLKNPLADWTGGVSGMEVPLPTLGSWVFNTDQSMFYVIMIPAAVMMLAAKNISRTRVGRALIAVRDNDLAAEVLGINLFTYKLRAFFLCAIYAGVAGSLSAHYTRSISPDHFDLLDSIWQLGMLIVGGAGYAVGPIFGTAFVRLLREFATFITPAMREVLPALLPFMDVASVDRALGPIFFAVVLMLFLVFEPRGLAHRWEILKAAWRLRPFAH